MYPPKYRSNNIFLQVDVFPVLSNSLITNHGITPASNLLIIFCAVTTASEESTITPSKSNDKGNLTSKLYFRDFKQPRRQWQQERQKSNRFNTQTQQFASHVWYIIFRHDYDVKRPGATSYGLCKHATQNFSFSCWPWMCPWKFNFRTIVPNLKKFISIQLNHTLLVTFTLPLPWSLLKVRVSSVDACIATQSVLVLKYCVCSIESASNAPNDDLAGYVLGGGGGGGGSSSPSPVLQTAFGLILTLFSVNEGFRLWTELYIDRGNCQACL